ncbi:transketolase [Bacteroidales bacterium OttesenSCG-928-K22]|nr:transketolase [Bacteroidales bacterium OttesenSCG-928-L14]MDL2240113.1 transketolase [Bacteroidales bacterium OttesenSCG-928-K22]
MNSIMLKNMATQVKRDSLRMIHNSQSGHPGGSLSCAEYFVCLYFSEMNIDANRFSLAGHGEDVFYLSNGHVCPAWYSTLARRGYFPIEELATLRQFGSRLQGHPSMSHNLPGIRSASGSLGQGLSVAVGHALAKKSSNDNSIVYSLLGDGELQEGQVWEAAMYAGAKGVDNLIAAVDYNGQQIDGKVDDVLSLKNISSKWESFGWHVINVKNGNNVDDILNALRDAKNALHKSTPVVLILHTVMSSGVDFMENNHKWHGVAPNDDQLAKALEQLKVYELTDY